MIICALLQAQGCREAAETDWRSLLQERTGGGGHGTVQVRRAAQKHSFKTLCTLI